MVGTESKEEHDELVEEILRRIEENDLYVKLEKCRWKVREVEFLEVVIGPEGIKIEKKKFFIFIFILFCFFRIRD